MKKLIDKYFELYERYFDIYGNKLVLLFQSGMFYEIYSYDYMYIDNISNLMQITIMKKNKNEVASKKNPYMCGFHISLKEKFVKILFDHDFVIVIYDKLIDDYGNNETKITNILHKNPISSIENKQI
jgi:DNA mismatch repair ATPase MutS